MASKSHLPHHACPLVPALLRRPVPRPDSCPNILSTFASSGFISVSHLPINQRSPFLLGERLLNSPRIFAEPAGTVPFLFIIRDFTPCGLQTNLAKESGAGSDLSSSTHVQTWGHGQSQGSLSATDVQSTGRWQLHFLPIKEWQTPTTSVNTTSATETTQVSASGLFLHSFPRQALAKLPTQDLNLGYFCQPPEPLRSKECITTPGSSTISLIRKDQNLTQFWAHGTDN